MRYSSGNHRLLHFILYYKCLLHVTEHSSGLLPVLFIFVVPWICMWLHIFRVTVKQMSEVTGFSRGPFQSWHGIPLGTYVMVFFLAPHKDLSILSGILVLLLLKKALLLFKSWLFSPLCCWFYFMLQLFYCFFPGFIYAVFCSYAVFCNFTLFCV